MTDSDDSDREFEKFLMASISGSDLTSGRADTGRENSKKLTKSLDWNVSSSEDIESKPPSRFIKTATLTELDNILAETPAPKPTHENTPPIPSLEPQGILAALESQMLVGDSTTTEGYTESIERQEFANRLAQQNSALHSLGNNIPDSPADKMGQTGTLEGLEELKEVVEEIRQKSSESSSKEISGTSSQKPNFQLNESSKLQSEESENDEDSESNNTGSIFSDASKSSISAATATEQTQTREQSPEPESVSISEAYESDTLKEDDSTDDESPSSAIDIKPAEHPEMDVDSLQPVTVQNVSVRSSPELSVSVSEATEKISAGKALGIGVNLEPYIETKSDIDEQEPSFSENANSKIEDDLFGKVSIENEDYFQEHAVSEEIDNSKTGNFKQEDNDFIVPARAPVEREEHAVQEQNKSLSSSVSVADIPPEDFGKTHEISLADSSLAELLNLTEETQKSKKLAHTFDPAQNNREKHKENLDATKTMYHKKPDFSHVKSSGYGTSYKPASSSRPRISPRLAAKVEAAKVEKRRKSAQLRMSHSQSQGFSSSGPIEPVNEENIESLREQLEQEKKRDQAWVLSKHNTSAFIIKTNDVRGYAEVVF